MEQEPRNFVTAGEMLSNRYVLYRQLLEHRGRLWDESKGELSTWGLPTDHPLACASAPAFERERIQRLIDLATGKALAGDTGRQVDREMIERWAASTPLLPAYFGDLTDAPGAALHDVVFKNTWANTAGTALVIALYAHKLDHGAFPEELSELAADGLTVSLRDPCGEAQFGYHPHGFSKPVLVASDVVLPAEQPLLWSVGAARAAIVQAYEPVGTSAPFRVSAGDYYATNSMSVNMDRDHTRLHAGTPDPNRIVFVILGLQADPVFVLPPGAVLQFTPGSGAAASAADGELK
jgi:hypothetical protein